MRRFLFACIHNAGRSQMAAAIFNHLADPAAALAISAGTQPAERVHPEVLEVMREIGIDLSTARPQKLTDSLEAGAEMLITMGCGEQCPYIPGLDTDDWPLPDPKGRDVATVRAIREEIAVRVRRLMEQRAIPLRVPAA
ncbi:MAG: low molecular weight phosphatase family protein [Acidobacteriota bacterium]